MPKIIDLETMKKVGSFPQGTGEKWRKFYLEDLLYDFAELDQDGDLVIQKNES